MFNQDNFTHLKNEVLENYQIITKLNALNSLLTAENLKLQDHITLIANEKLAMKPASTPGKGGRKPKETKG